MADEISSPGNESLWLYCQKLFNEIHHIGFLITEASENNLLFPRSNVVLGRYYRILFFIQVSKAMKNVC